MITKMSKGGGEPLDAFKGHQGIGALIFYFNGEEKVFHEAANYQ